MRIKWVEHAQPEAKAKADRAITVARDARRFANVMGQMVGLVEMDEAMNAVGAEAHWDAVVEAFLRLEDFIDARLKDAKRSRVKG